MLLDITMILLITLIAMLIEEYYRSPYLKEYLKGKVMALVLSFSIMYQGFKERFNRDR
jgi:hypothetical protein